MTNMREPFDSFTVDEKPVNIFRYQFYFSMVEFEIYNFCNNRFFMKLPFATKQKPFDIYLQSFSIRSLETPDLHEGKWWNCFHFSPELAFFLRSFIEKAVSPILIFDLAQKHFCFSQRKKNNKKTKLPVFWWILPILTTCLHMMLNQQSLTSCLSPPIWHWLWTTDLVSLMNNFWHITRKLVRAEWFGRPDDLQGNTVSQEATIFNAKKLQLTCHHCKKRNLQNLTPPVKTS